MNKKKTQNYFLWTVIFITIILFTQPVSAQECVNLTALNNYISQWKQGTLPMPDLMLKIADWKSGTGCGQGNLLVPGTGFTSATQQPAAIGSPDQNGFDEKAIARWDVVPFQDFNSTFNVGVVAFHMNGIDRVEFSVNGGPWLAVSEMTSNPQINVNEYWATLRASDFADGQIEVRAIAYPIVGIPRVLQGVVHKASGEESLFLNANANHTLPALVRFVSPTGNDSQDGLTPQTPMKDITNAIWSMANANHEIDGATVYLLPGQHILTGAGWPLSQMTNSDRWLTIAAASGVDRASVTLTGKTNDERFGYSKLVHLKNLSIVTNKTGPVVSSSISDARLWYENVIVDGLDRWSLSSNMAFGATDFSGGKYMTNSLIKNVVNGPLGFALIRDTRVEHIASDAYSGVYLAVNSSCSGLDQTGWPETDGPHPDIAQYYGTDFENVILYGLTTDQTVSYPNGVQGLFLSGGQINTTHTNYAIVNSIFYNSPSWSQAYSIDGPCRHIYVKDSTFIGPRGYGQFFTAKNFVVENTVFKDSSTGPIVSPPAVAGVTYR